MRMSEQLEILQFLRTLSRKSLLRLKNELGIKSTGNRSSEELCYFILRIAIKQGYKKEDIISKSMNSTDDLD